MVYRCPLSGKSGLVMYVVPTDNPLLNGLAAALTALCYQARISMTTVGDAYFHLSLMLCLATIVDILMQLVYHFT